jgi:hypothetical protein
MNMVGHYHISPEQPRVRCIPGITQNRVRRVARENVSTILGADRDVDDDGRVVLLIDWLMDAMLTANFIHTWRDNRRVVPKFGTERRPSLQALDFVIFPSHMLDDIIAELREFDFGRAFH